MSLLSEVSVYGWLHHFTLASLTVTVSLCKDSDTLEVEEITSSQLQEGIDASCYTTRTTK